MSKGGYVKWFDNMHLMRKQEALELSWAAGFFDGEGCCSSFVIKKRKTRVQRLVVTQYHDPETLERFVSACGVGRLYGPYTKKSTGNLYWQVEMGKRDSIIALTKMWPYLSGPKKKQALRVFPNQSFR